VYILPYTTCRILNSIYHIPYAVKSTLATHRAADILDHENILWSWTMVYSYMSIDNKIIGTTIESEMEYRSEIDKILRDLVLHVYVYDNRAHVVH